METKDPDKLCYVQLPFSKDYNTALDKPHSRRCPILFQVNVVEIRSGTIKLLQN